MKKILLVAPDFNAVDAMVRDGIYLTLHKESMAPLGLATVAALTPEDIEVDIWDEAVRGQVAEATDFKKAYDLVGLPAMPPISGG